MSDTQKTVLWIGLILVTLNFIIGGWTTWKKIIFTGPKKSSTPGLTIPGIPNPGIPGLPPVIPLISTQNAANTPAKNAVTNA